MGKKLNLPEKEIIDLYIDKKISSYKIADIYNCSSPIILKILKRNNIPRRKSNEYEVSLETRKKQSDFRMGFNKGKTYEEMYGEETGKRLRGVRSKFFKGKKQTIEHRRNNSETRKRLFKEGKLTSWIKGLTKFTDKRIAKYAREKIGTKRPDLTVKNLTNEYQQKCLRGQFKRPTKPEFILKQIIEKHNLQFNYVGNGEIWFRTKKGGFNPDFLSKNPKHIIEVFGDYFHKMPKNIARDKNRLEAYSRYGYKTLILWEHELTGINPLSEAEIVNKVKTFIG